MMKKFIDLLKDSQALVYGIVGVSYLAGYLIFGKKMIQQHYHVNLTQEKNMLDANFEQLFKQNKKKNIFKIVLTEIDQSKGTYKSLIIAQIKKIFLGKDVRILINCSPRKLLAAGCANFLQSFQEKDYQNSQYLYNLIKTQLLVEDTIQKIDFVSQMKHEDPGLAIMLCDTNCLDVKLSKTTTQIQKLVFQKCKVQQKDLYNLYNVVLHFVEGEEPANSHNNTKISQLWRNSQFQGDYYQFQYDRNQSQKQNTTRVIKALQKSLSSFLPKNFQWSVEKDQQQIRE